MRPTVLLLLLSLVLLAIACSSHRTAAGYYQSKNEMAELWLYASGRFDMLQAGALSDSLYSRTCGKWSSANKKLQLVPDGQAGEFLPFEDSMSRFTGISSFHFRDSRNRPVPVRYLLLGKGQPKPHFGNSLFFFAGDFKATDTIRFFFRGYAPFQYPGSIPYSIGENAHTITLHEPLQHSFFKDSLFYIRKKKLKSNSAVFNKKKEVLP
ncbi:MAG TPA: hypothetical protein PKC69_05575 [Chitinophagaceae bacterium]|nr:hypothetical protein [Chitinophagaceae bacterium]